MGVVYLTRNAVWYTASFCLFLSNDTATTATYTLSLHDALPILPSGNALRLAQALRRLLHRRRRRYRIRRCCRSIRSEEHTSELQSQSNLVCRLLLEKKKLYHTAIPELAVSQTDYPQHAHHVYSH